MVPVPGPKTLLVKGPVHVPLKENGGGGGVGAGAGAGTGVGATGFLLSPPQAESASDSRTMKATTPFAAVVIGLSTVLALLSLIFPPFQNVRTARRVTHPPPRGCPEKTLDGEYKLESALFDRNLTSARQKIPHCRNLAVNNRLGPRSPVANDRLRNMRIGYSSRSGRLGVPQLPRSLVRRPIGNVKLRLTAVSDPQHGGFTAGSSPVSWGSIDELFVNLIVSMILLPVGVAR